MAITSPETMRSSRSVKPLASGLRTLNQSAVITPEASP
jgi:hypothetical protein